MDREAKKKLKAAIGDPIKRVHAKAIHRLAGCFTTFRRTRRPESGALGRVSRAALV
jgi:hypothetical protein